MTQAFNNIRKLRGIVSVTEFGAVCDGVTNDAPAIQAAIDYASSLNVNAMVHIPPATLKVNSTINITCDIWCEGILAPDASIGSAPADYNRFVAVIAETDYRQKRYIYGLKIAGNVTLRSAGVNGIRIDCQASMLVRCTANQLNVGIVARFWGITLDHCSAQQCNTNLSAYARAINKEINCFHVLGGSYDGAVNCAAKIGDRSWSDAASLGTNHGVEITLDGGANFDASHVEIDNCSGVKLDTIYFEGMGTSTSDAFLKIGGAGDGYLRNISIDNCFFNNGRYAIKCESAVNGLRVGRNFYTAVSTCALYIKSDLYHFSYESGDATGSFTLGPEVHTGFRFLLASQIGFVNATIPHLGLYRGVQTIRNDVGEWFPSGKMRSGVTEKTDVSGTTLRRYTTPQTGLVGTVSAGGVFTCSIASQCASFNGGDNVTLSLGGATYVRYVDYQAGIIYLDGASSTGAATLSQIQAAQRTESRGTAAPTTGTWAVGDRQVNSSPAVGQPKAWTCTVAGAPGTWVSEGNL